VEVRSPDIGAAAAFADAVDYDDVQPFPVPGKVLVLGSWVWQEGRDTAWWLGAIVEAQSAANAAQRVASVVAARTGVVHTLAMTLDVTASTATAPRSSSPRRRSPSTPYLGPPRPTSSRFAPARTRAAAGA
jgi:hypothetical protein